MFVGSFEISDKIAAQDLRALEDGLAAHAAQAGAPALVFIPLSILKRDAKGSVVAGLYGKTFWNWCYIDSLWVDVVARGRGWGRDLMEAAEQEARERGCVGLYLWTQSFDAPEFYKKIGYEEFLAWDDFPIGHKRYGFMKRIAA